MTRVVPGLICAPCGRISCLPPAVTARPPGVATALVVLRSDWPPLVAMVCMLVPVADVNTPADFAASARFLSTWELWKVRSASIFFCKIFRLYSKLTCRHRILRACFAQYLVNQKRFRVSFCTDGDLFFEAFLSCSSYIFQYFLSCQILQFLNKKACEILPHQLFMQKDKNR